MQLAEVKGLLARKEQQLAEVQLKERQTEQRLVEMQIEHASLQERLELKQKMPSKDSVKASNA